jgi:hypothetical protein
VEFLQTVILVNVQSAVNFGPVDRNVHKSFASSPLKRLANGLEKFMT